MSLKEDIQNILRKYKDTIHGGNNERAAKALGVNAPTFWRWLSGKNVPRVETLEPVFEALHATITLPEREPEHQDLARDVCFVDAKVVPAGDGLPPAASEDYLAVPLVDEVGAGPGIIPQGRLISWFLVWRYQKSVMHKHDLIAVRIGNHSTSMLPTLRPEDIVLVDRQDIDCATPGRIMLVLDPDGAGMIKRVALTPIRKDGGMQDIRITFYSDNVALNPPVVYSLRDDYGGDWRKAIGGHIVWAWSDMEGR